MVIITWSHDVIPTSSPACTRRTSPGILSSQREKPIRPSPLERWGRFYETASRMVDRLRKRRRRRFGLDFSVAGNHREGAGQWCRLAFLEREIFAAEWFQNWRLDSG